MNNHLKYIFLIVLCCVPVWAFGQAGQIITGRLYSETEGELIGAAIVEVDKNGRILSSTVTDYSGNFSLKIKSESSKLKFSYVGYKSIEMPIGQRRKFDVKLESATEIKEVVVSAQRMYSGGGLPIPEIEFSGAMQRISTKAFEGLSVASIDEALQGRISGLDIVGNSGDVGSGSSLRIRGITSINSSSTPLILLNDIPFESNIDASFDFATATQDQFATLLNISPSDIEEISVLKDGAAAAIWGSRGANGVISITTKKGVTGPTRVSYTYQFSAYQQPQGIKMLNGDDYTMLMKQAYFNRNQNEADSDIPAFNYDPIGNADEYENYNNNTDWVDAVTQIGLTHDHNFSISGGGDKARFRASLGYYNQTGTIIEQEMKRISARMNLEYQVSSRLKFISDFSITNTDNNKSYDIYNSADDKWYGLLDIAYKKMPNASIYRQDANGNDTGVFFNVSQNEPGLSNEQKNIYLNPVALAKLASYKQSNMRIIPTLRLQYDFLDPDVQKLRYNGYVTFDLENVHDAKFLPREATTFEWNREEVNRSYNKDAEALTILTDHNLTWSPNLGDDHSLLLYGSWQMQVGSSQYQEFEKYGIPSYMITGTSAASNIKTFSSASSQMRTMAFLARAHYLLLNRYVFDGTLRFDGSTRFGYNNRWGMFPALSGKWIISREPFMERAQSWMSEFSLRLGWGVTGNQPDKEYLYFSRYNGSWTDGNNYIDISTIKPASLKLANLKWERSSSYNAGIDLNLFDYRYHLDVNVYHRRTENLLFKDQSIPSSSGFSSISYINAGTMDNDGWELNFNTNRMLQFGDWTIDFNLNFSNYINTIVELDENVLKSYNKDFDYKSGSDYLTRIQVNNSFGSIYGFRYKGVYQYDTYKEGRGGTCPVVYDANGNVVKDSYGNPIPMYYAYGTSNAYKFRGGDAIYEDVNHDGSIDELDIVYLGNCNPKLNGGFGTTIRYKRFTLNAFFNFRYGNKIINNARRYAENMYSDNNQSIATNWRWRKDGDVTEIPRALNGAGYNWQPSDRFVEDGSFLRFKQLTLNYSVDPKILKKAKMQQLNFSLTLNNLVTFTKYTGVNPEVSINDVGMAIDENRTPRSRYLTVGVTVGF